MRSPMPITSRGRYLRNSIASLHAGLERIEQPPIGQIERDPLVDAQHLGRRRLGFGQPHFGPRRERRRLAVGEVDDADLVAGVDQPGQRAAAGDLQVVRMGTDGDHIELFVRRIRHDGHSRGSSSAGLSAVRSSCKKSEFRQLTTNTIHGPNYPPILPELGLTARVFAYRFLDKLPLRNENSGLPRAAGSRPQRTSRNVRGLKSGICEWRLGAVWHMAIDEQR